MNMDKLIDAGKQMFGCVKHAVGRVGGNDKPRADNAGPIEGKAQATVGSTKVAEKPNH
jgi:uncharacterized protein YjbJ (UPF0337 family)